MSRMKFILESIKTDAGLCILLTLMSIGTRSFFFQSHNAVPFEIQDEITLVWALKDFLLGQWNEITGPIHRFVASYLYTPFYGSYFAYLWFTGAIIGLDEVRESFLLQSAHGYDSINVWVWVPRLVSWLFLVLSIPLQFVLTKIVTQNKQIAFIAGILLVFAFTHLYSSAFGLPDGIGLVVFQVAIIQQQLYLRNRTRANIVILSFLIACTILVQLLNAVVLVVSGIFLLFLVRKKEAGFSFSSFTSEVIVIAGCTTLFVLIVNPLIYLVPDNVISEFHYGVSEWGPQFMSRPIYYVAHIARVICDEILGFGLTVLLSIAFIWIVFGRPDLLWAQQIVVPLLSLIVGMAFVTELTYETNLIAIYVPACILAAWVFIQLWPSNVASNNLDRHVLRYSLCFVLALFAFAMPISNWFSLYRLSLVEGTRSSARNWIHENIQSGSKIYIAPYTYTAPLIKSLEQVQLESSVSELAYWRINSKIGRELSPSYFVITDPQSYDHKDLLPDYYVQSLFTYGNQDCEIGRVIDIFLCPYNPLRGSFSYFSEINQMPKYPDELDMVLLREFSPLCSMQDSTFGTINYRTSVLSNNIQDLCRFGPIIQIYQIIGLVEN
tara:strand:- start:5187 stop:7010 length:1824 start_codon:yes stop_codon:yes gene_type:complete